jgi:uncharacterized protein YgbK (DUF1537 family)
MNINESDIQEQTFTELTARYPAGDTGRARALLDTEPERNKWKIVVLDDDPTGVQTVHDVSVYTGWTAEHIAEGFDEPGTLFFILTNSRGMTRAETAVVHTEIGKTIARIARRQNREFIVISRSDSTLRGHYPLETEALKNAIEAETQFSFDGEIICPFFLEGGRYTAEDIHYVRIGDKLVPAAQTEFAGDKTFGYQHSNLKAWVEEKTGGNFPQNQTLSIPLADLRKGDMAGIVNTLLSVKDFAKVIINALDYDDIRVFCAALYRALNAGKHFMIRSGAAIPKILGGISDKPLLRREDLVEAGVKRGGLVVIGSHVQKTTRQLDLLLENKKLVPIEFNTHLVTDDKAFTQELKRVQAACEEALNAGRTTVIFTCRKRFDLNTGNREDELRVSMKIAGAVTSFVTRLKDKPRFIIAKGGITSSEIGVQALRVRKALVLGQVLPGVPVWLTGCESRFPNMPYIIFPGNVGEEDGLKRIVEMLE